MTPEPLLQMPLTVTDQMNRRVAVPFPPRRIVSLVPSQTELLFDLGLGDRVVGVTKFCLHPAGARQSATVIGGTKNFHFEQIDELRPDLIIGNKEENYQDGIEQLAARYPLWMSDILTLTDSTDMIRRVGLITGRKEAAEQISQEILWSFAALPPVAAPIPAAYFIWRKPYMVAAAGTFIDDLLSRAGFRNVFGHLGRYPEVTPELLRAAAPQQILLSSEPYPFGEKHLAEFQEICPQARIRIVDGELFSWYGSRLRHSAAYVKQLQAG
ncbi:ABC-type Fe3+-hydroxamate transport system substrate-binding protein [Hymenobacter luteus]|uniref:ABC-type Fe3+-hydroxamate transport system substrate-binding protein n=2 Tax=Hymenobacter TaxID=89966 RepID=A0A7W9T0B8_9BACT|nr:MULTISPECIES: helical backbone metal receptor [Hymenobacter]MBB4600698.1 ABC-type Fe3+-hydroxamate transport system substrate-binding protein [Hymenobacter latericoloratus]MBB6059095.1 ABC-type Fe3+-hydroxamate transport system substrate-binding protein [Hymenobacter luteus]